MDTLQARIAQLEQENAALRALLKRHGIAYPETTENQISAAANQGSRMLQNEVTPQMASFFYSYFRGRKNVYSVRSRPKDGRAGYYALLGLYALLESNKTENRLQGLPQSGV